MADPLLQLEDRMAAAFATVAGRPVDPVVRASDRADAQANGALALAKELGRPPRELAQAVIDAADLDPVALTAALHPHRGRSARRSKRRSSDNGTLAMRVVLFDPSRR